MAAARSSPTAPRAASDTCSPGAPSTPLAPSAGGRQVELKLDYSGGWGSTRKNVWKTLRNTCGPYTGPPLAVARHGVHRARRQPLGAAVVAADAAELRRPAERDAGGLGAPALALDRRPPRADRQHRTGPTGSTTTSSGRSSTTVRPCTASSRRRSATRSTVRPQPLRRHVQLGVRRRAGSARTASSCTRAPARSATGSTRTARTRSGKGERYRATIIGPGVTPDVMWQGDAARRLRRRTSIASSPTPARGVRVRHALQARLRPREGQPALRSPHDRGGRVRPGRRHRRQRAALGRGAGAARRRLGRALLAGGPAGDDGHELGRSGRATCTTSSGCRRAPRDQREVVRRMLERYRARAAADRRGGRRRPRPGALVPARGRLVLEPAADRHRARARRDLGLLRGHGLVRGGRRAASRAPTSTSKPRDGSASPPADCAAVEDSASGIRAAHVGGHVGGRRSQPALPAGRGGSRRSRGCRSSASPAESRL